VQGNIGAARVYCFFVWLDFSTFLLLIASSGKGTERLKEIGRSVNPIFDSLLDMLTIGVLIYFGWYITAIALFIATGLKASFYDDLLKD
jgi:hypothetical protein